jgi:hypothetical protein
MQLPYLFSQPVLCLAELNGQSCPLIGYDPSRVSSCFRRQPAAHINNTENMVFQEGKRFQQFLMENIGDLEMWLFIRIVGYFWT